MGEVEALLELGRNNSRLTLVLSELRDDLGPRAFRAFLLRHRVIGTYRAESVCAQRSHESRWKAAYTI